MGYTSLYTPWNKRLEICQNNQLKLNIMNQITKKNQNQKVKTLINNSISIYYTKELSQPATSSLSISLPLIFKVSRQKFLFFWDGVQIRYEPKDQT